MFFAARSVLFVVFGGRVPTHPASPLVGGAWHSCLFPSKP
jgi:hypothetical protein